MLKPEFRPSQLPEFTPPGPPHTALKKALARWALITLAAGAGLTYVLLTWYLTHLALAPAVAIGLLLGMHLATVFVARLREGQWLGLPGLLVTLLAAMTVSATAGMADPTDHMAPAGGYVPLPAMTTGNWILRSILDMADNAAPIVVIIGALVSSWFAVHNARPR